MTSLPPLGARSLPASLYAANGPTDSRANQPTVTNPAVTATDSPISLSSDGIDLQKRLDSVGNRTVDYAQGLITSFAQQLFGDAAKGSTISFDSASLEASSSYAVGVQHSADANGSTDAAALQLNDSSHFIGKGTITTADGRKFDFEMEIQYSDQLQASASETQASDASLSQPDGPAIPATPASTATPAAPASGDSSASGAKPASTGSSSLPTVAFPNVDFAGTLADLFKLIGHNLQGTISTPGSDNNQGNDITPNTLRSLSLRLLNLVDHKSSDTYSPSKAKSAADAYGSQGAASATPVADAGTTPAPAAASTPAASTAT